MGLVLDSNTKTHDVVQGGRVADVQRSAVGATTDRCGSIYVVYAFDSTCTYLLWLSKKTTHECVALTCYHELCCMQVAPKHAGRHRPTTCSVESNNMVTLPYPPNSRPPSLPELCMMNQCDRWSALCI